MDYPGNERAGDIMEPDYSAQINAYSSYLHEWNASYEEYAKSVGLSFTSLTILCAIYRTEQCTQKRLCEQCFLPKQTVNAAVAAFYKKAGSCWRNCRRTAGTKLSILPNWAAPKPNVF